MIYEIGKYVFCIDSWFTSDTDLWNRPVIVIRVCVQND